MPSLADIPARLAALEQQVAQLSGSQSEALFPNYLTFNPANGEVSANFTGLVNALGLILPAAATLGQTPQNSIVWKSLANGAVIAWIEGTEFSGSGEYLTLTAQGQAGIGPGGAGITLQANSADATAEPQLFVSSQDSGDAGISVYSGVAGAARYLIITGGNLSSWVKDGGNNNQNNLRSFYINGGTGNVTWAGSSALSNLVNIGAVVPFTTTAGCIVCANQNNLPLGQIPIFLAAYAGGNPAQFGVQAQAPSGTPPASTSNGFYWLAFGF